MKLSRETNVGELRIFLKSRSCKEIRDRLRAVIERRKGFSFRKIADKIERSVSYVKTWNDRFKKEGALGLLDKNRDNKKSAPEANLKQIKQVLLKYFDPKNELSCIKTKDIQKLFQEELNLKRSASSVKKILKKLGYRYIKPRRQHEKNNPKAMKTWEEQDLPVFFTGYQAKLSR